MSADHERYARAVTEAVAARIDVLRTQRRMSVNELADFSGVDRGFLSRLLRGTANPTIRTLALLANCLDVSFATLVKIDEPKRPGPTGEPRRPRTKTGSG